MGALYIRRRPRVRLEPLFSGGGQERGLRSGTLSPALCVGMGAAAKICLEEMERDSAWIKFLSQRLIRLYIHKYLSNSIEIIFMGNNAVVSCQRCL